MHPVFAQALKPFAPPQSVVHSKFNDDDWYVVKAATGEVIRQVGCKAGYKPVPEAGQVVLSGMRAKHFNGVGA